MSNVEVINKTLIDQRVNNLENSKVFLPFNVSKSQVEKLQELLNKIKVTFYKLFFILSSKALMSFIGILVLLFAFNRWHAFIVLDLDILCLSYINFIILSVR